MNMVGETPYKLTLEDGRYHLTGWGKSIRAFNGETTNGRNAAHREHAIRENAYRAGFDAGVEYARMADKAGAR